MTLKEAVQSLVLGEGRQFRVLSRRDLHTLFPRDSERSLGKGIAALVDTGLLRRVTRGVYVNMAVPPSMRGTGMMVDALRPGHLSYLSYESALAEYGSLSQVPFWLVFATTGASGEHSTPEGDIAFRHTSRSHGEIIRNTKLDERLGVLTARPSMAYEDLARSCRHLGRIPHDIDMDLQDELDREWDLRHAA